ncbi:hypothetical protein VPH35_106892 [Triticum aestivum]
MLRPSGRHVTITQATRVPPHGSTASPFVSTASISIRLHRDASASSSLLLSLNLYHASTKPKLLAPPVPTKRAAPPDPVASPRSTGAGAAAGSHFLIVLPGQTTRSGVPPPDPVPVGTLRVTGNPTAADMVASAGELAPVARLSTPLQDPLLPCSTTTSGPTRATGSPKAAAMVASTDERAPTARVRRRSSTDRWAAMALRLSPPLDVLTLFFFCMC